MKQIKMSHNVYIVEMYDKHTTGFTTYKQELLRCLKNTGTVISHIISLRCPTTEFDVTSDEDIVSYLCPGKRNDVTEVSCALLALHIENRKDNIFFLISLLPHNG